VTLWDRRFRRSWLCDFCVYGDADYAGSESLEASTPLPITSPDYRPR
jgi:hypothetical protein